MKAFTSTTGRVAVIDRPDIDTDQIIPKPFLKRIERTGLRRVPVLRLATGRARPAAARVRAERPAFAGASILLTGTQLRLRLVARACRLGAAGLRVRRRHRLVVRGHLPHERRQDRPGHDRAAGSRGEAPDRARRPGRGCRDERRPGATHDHRTRRAGHSSSSSTRRRGRGSCTASTRSRSRSSTRTRSRPTSAPTAWRDDASPSCPATGSGPRSPPRPSACSTRSGSGTRAPVRRQRDPRAGHAAAGRDARRPAGRPTPSCSAQSASPSSRDRPVRPEQGLLALRKELGVYANLRPARADGIDLVIVRELTGGLYFGAKGTREDGTWFDTCEYTRPRGGADRTARLRDRARARRTAHLGRQGERAAHLTAVARRRHRDRSDRLPGRRRSIMRSSTRSR